eukprot:TRINITY_DN11786_c0_g1_i1.p1 TRINITY_DN11786_c0_g1~~TRINITY_DN11786_c0_g1_i1.p1  ORF type:complete len:540 (-),score=96.18 TRINITY_DN11786_c0_g1_i1:83-1678(-)
MSKAQVQHSMDEDSSTTSSDDEGEFEENEGGLQDLEEEREDDPQDPPHKAHLDTEVSTPPGFSLKGGPMRVLLGLCVVAFFGLSLGVFYGPVAESIQEAMKKEANIALLGLLIGIPNLLGALLRLPLTMLIYQHGPRLVTSLTLLISFVGMLVVTIIMGVMFPHSFQFKTHYPLLLIFGAFVGVGQAIVPVLNCHLSHWYPKEKIPTFLCIVNNISLFGPGLFTFFLPAVTKTIPVWTAYMIWLIFLLLSIIIHFFLAIDSAFFQVFRVLKSLDKSLSVNQLHRQASEIAKKIYNQEVIPEELFLTTRKVEYIPENGPEVTVKDSDSVVASLANGKLWLVSYLYFIAYGGTLGLTAWFPIYFIDNYGIMKDVSGFLSGLLAILVVVSRVAGIFVVGRFLDGELVGIIGMSVFSAGTLLMVFSPNLFGLAVVGLLLISFGLGFSLTSVHRLLYKYLPNNIPLNAALVSTLGTLGGFVIPVVMGLVALADGGWMFGWAFLSALGLLGLVLTIISFFFFRKIGKGEDQTEVAWL